MKYIYVKVEVPDDTDIFDVHDRIVMEFPHLRPNVYNDDEDLVTVYDNFDTLMADVDAEGAR